MTCLAYAFANACPALVCFITAGDGDKDIASVADASGVEL